MRCPKCGYISFDNVETCLKCNKNISAATKAFQGSTLNVAVPAFLVFSASDEEDMDMLDEGDMDGEIEFADPDLEILVDGEDDEGIDFSLNEEEEEGVDDADFVLANEFDDAESIQDSEETEIEDLSADLGQFEETSEEDTFEFKDSDEGEEADGVALDFPDELDDISDLSPPEEPDVLEPAASVEEEVEPELESLAAEPEDDLNFSSLDIDFDLSGLDESAQEPAAAQELPADDGAFMDEELNFDLDLGGLSIHDEK